jgi:glycerol-3-phosphate dehydrogenase
MQRDLRRLADTRFDLVIIGAGFYGALAAWDATLRGLSVALIDRNDFGGATSFNNHKTLHGGLRSLQSMNFTQMRLFIRERRALARVAPHLVRVMPFVVPTYQHVTRSRALMRVALAINDTVASDRHQGLGDPALNLPASRTIARDECLRLNPLINPEGVTGGAVWHDYQMLNTDRMTLSFVLSAAARGAAAANYVEATALVREGGRAAGIRVADRIGGAVFDLRAHTVLNATGPWAASLLATLDPALTAPAAHLSLAMNLIVGPLPVQQACGGLSHGRFLFLIPWRHVSLVGTSHDHYEGGPEPLAVTRARIEALLDDARDAFPRANLAQNQVRLVHRGLLPAVSSAGRSVKLLRESTVVDHRADGTPGLLSIFGVRYTTARDTAARAVDAVFADRGITEPPRSQTHVTAVEGGAIADTTAFRAAAEREHGAALGVATVHRLTITYGTTYTRVARLLLDEPSLASPLSDECPVTGAEIAHAARHESAVTLSDALIRRTEAGSAGNPGQAAVTRAAQVMRDELGWNDERLAAEIAAADGFSALPAYRSTTPHSGPDFTLRTPDFGLSDFLPIRFSTAVQEPSSETDRS